MDTELKRKLLSSKENADRAISGILGENELSQDTVLKHLRPYIMYKFLLSESEMKTEDFTELVKTSIVKASKIDPELLKEIRGAQKCTSASSVAIKKVLVYMDLQRQLGIKFDPEKTGDIETLGDIAALLVEKIKG